MSRLLRQSSRFARLARASQPLRLTRISQPSITARSIAPTVSPIRSSIAWRPYSSEPPKPNREPEKDEKESKDEKETAKPEESQEDPHKKPERPPPLRDDWVHLTEGEVEAFGKFGESLPPAQREQLAGFLKEVRQTGVPEEARDLLKKRMRGEKLTMLEKGQMLRAMVRMGSAYAHIEAEKESKKHFDPNNRDDPKEQQSKDGSEKDPKQEKDASKKGGSQGSAPPPGSGPSPGGSWAESLQSIVIILSLIWAWEYFTGSNRQQITWQEAKMNYLYKGLVKKFVVEGHNVRMELHPDAQSQQQGNSLYFTVGSAESFEANLREAQAELDIPPGDRIPVSYEAGGSTLGNLFLAFGPTLLFIGLIVWTQRSMGGRSGGGGGMFGIGKSKAKKFNAESAVKVKFADVAGLDEAKVEVTEFVSFLKNPQKFEKLGAKIPRGAILAGPPGTGKTLLAKATAGESGVPFFSVSGSEFVEMFVGVGPSRVRDLFAEGRKNAPCIIFIDEIDAIGRSRSGNGRFSGGNDERESTLNQILTEMDGFNTREQVVVLAGTNRPEILDDALMRPGRFDRHIHCDRPTMKGRKEIFQVYLKKIITKEDQEHLVGRLSTLTPGFSGADISNVVNEAALIAARANAEDVKMVHFEQAIERVIGGLERKSLVLRPEEKKTVAYHEAGHAICGWFLEHADPLLKVSIIPRGQGALGYAQYLPQDAYLMSTKQLMDRMAMTLGGRISEELHFPTVTSGASDDFKKVSQMARKMVKDWGMSAKIGPVHYEDDPNSMHKGHSEATALKIDEEVTRIVNEAYQRCHDLLTEKKKEVGLIAEELLKKEMLVRDDLVRILGKRPFGDNHDEFEKYFGGDKDSKGQPPNPVETDNPDQGTPAPAFKQLP